MSQRKTLLQSKDFKVFWCNFAPQDLNGVDLFRISCHVVSCLTSLQLAKVDLVSIPAKCDMAVKVNFISHSPWGVAGRKWSFSVWFHLHLII